MIGWLKQLNEDRKNPDVKLLLIQRWTIRLNTDPFYASAGWFHGEPFRLINLTLLEAITDIETVTIIDLQVAKLGLYIGFEYGV